MHVKSGVRRKLKGKKPPEGWELIEEVIDDFEQQMKDAVNEDQDGKRRAELTWKIHRLHWEKNRFIFDLMYQRKVMSKELVRVAAAVGMLFDCSTACAQQTLLDNTGSSALNFLSMPVLDVHPYLSRSTC